MEQTVIGGVAKQVPVVYTQKFSSVPSQGPTPQKGEIGLGTITGKVGVLQTAKAESGASIRGGKATVGTIAVGALFMVIGSLIMSA